MDDFRSVAEILRFRAQVQKERRGYVFLPDGQTEGASLTYGELDRQSRGIAAALQESHSGGERALLVYPPGLEFIAAFFGCLYAGVVAVPAYPPHPARPSRGLSRLRAIAGDAEVTVVLTTESIASMAAVLWVEAPELAGARWLATDRLGPERAEAWQEPQLDPRTLAFLQYTSGSTAAPRGVMVSHRNLLHNLAYIRYCEENDADTVSVSWLPVYHDMGLIEGILEPAFGGYPAYLMAPASFLQRPLRWLAAISRYRATNSGGPNFAYDLCARKITPEQSRELDLSSWRVAYNGAEPVRKETLERFLKVFGACGFRWKAFYPGYGLAEATLVVSSGRQADEPVFQAVNARGLAADRVEGLGTTERDRITLVACGRPSFGTRVVIAHPDHRTPCAPGEVGEIWVSSPSVALGYWNRAKETERTFHAYLANTGEGPFLRTGDLGFILQGELFVTGRLKDVIIIRGRKHYPQDLELTVEQSHPAIRPGCSAAVSVPGPGGEECLVVLAEVDPRGLARDGSAPGAAGTSGLPAIDAIREAVAEHHDLQVCAVSLLAPGSLPKTSSGKLQRHACRTAFVAGTLESVIQWVHAPGRVGAAGQDGGPA